MLSWKRTMTDTTLSKKLITGFKSWTAASVAALGVYSQDEDAMNAMNEIHGEAHRICYHYMNSADLNRMVFSMGCYVEGFLASTEEFDSYDQIRTQLERWRDLLKAIDDKPLVTEVKMKPAKAFFLMPDGSLKDISEFKIDVPKIVDPVPTKKVDLTKNAV